MEPQAPNEPPKRGLIRRPKLPTIGGIKERVDTVTSRVKDTVGKVDLNQTRQSLGEIVRSPEGRAAIGEGLRRVSEDPRVQQVVATAEQKVLESRDSRLHHEQLNAQRNFLQRAMSSAVGKGVTTLIEMIPSPILYGPGDGLTAFNAVIGKNIVTGELLDPVERWIHAGAAAIPLVPATPVVEIAKIVRRNVEDTVHHKKLGNDGHAKAHATEVVSGVKDLGTIVKTAWRMRKK